MSQSIPDPEHKDKPRPEQTLIPTGSISGKFSGRDLVVDPQSGYLTSGAAYKYDGFTSAKKVLFIKLFQHSPNIGKVCKEVGINRTTYLNHYHVDSVFRRDIDDLREDDLDSIEEKFMADGKEGKFLPGIATLRAYRPDRWNPDNKVTITHQSTMSAADRAAKLGEVLDADIISDQRLELEGRG